MSMKHGEESESYLNTNLVLSLFVPPSQDLHNLEKEIFWCTENNFWLFTQNILVFTNIKYLYIHNHVHTTDSVRPQQWPLALSNRLQVFYDNNIFYWI